MKVYCSWCAKYMGEKDIEGRTISHSICQGCYQKLIVAAELEEHHGIKNPASVPDLVAIK